MPGEKTKSKIKASNCKVFTSQIQGHNLKNKKKIKGSGISITDNLAVKRMKILQKARQEHAFENAWTQDGRIMYYYN